MGLAKGIQIFGDSMVMINWMLGVNNMEDFLLWPIYDEIQIFRSVFNLSLFNMFTKKEMEKLMLSPKQNCNWIWVFGMSRRLKRISPLNTFKIQFFYLFIGGVMAALSLIVSVLLILDMDLFIC